ncbi:MAG: glycosyltransferase [Chloroflexota bacterium]
MRVLMVSKACIVGLYQTKLEAIAAQPGIDLGVLMPNEWRDRSGRIAYEPVHTRGYQTWVDPIRFNGKYHLHYYPSLEQRIKEFQPHLIHFDEEPYNLSTWLGLRSAQKHGIKFLFFTWQNILRSYPPPFRWMEGEVLKKSDYAIMGNQAAVDVFQAKGYDGPHAVVPQFGIAPSAFLTKPKPNGADLAGPAHIAFAGRLIQEKGIDLLLEALATLKEMSWRCSIAGQGPERAQLEKQVEALGLQGKIVFTGSLPSTEMPAFLQGVDILVLPSRTRPNWKEQFGRIIIEAMASEVVVVGSSSGEIPHVIDRHGVIFPEDQLIPLKEALSQLIANPIERIELGRAARKYALNRFSQEKIAQRTVDVYQELIESA